MKLTKVLCVSSLAFTLAACSSSTSSSKSASASASSTSEEETTTEEVATEGKYEVTNNTGKTITELHFYYVDGQDIGENYLDSDLKDGETVTVDIKVSEEDADGYAMKVEYMTEDGDDVVVFDSLHLEEASMYLKSAADVESGATPFTPAE